MKKAQQILKNHIVLTEQLETLVFLLDEHSGVRLLAIQCVVLWLALHSATGVVAALYCLAYTHHTAHIVRRCLDPFAREDVSVQSSIWLLWSAALFAQSQRAPDARRLDTLGEEYAADCY